MTDYLLMLGFVCLNSVCFVMRQVVDVLAESLPSLYQFRSYCAYLLHIQTNASKQPLCQPPSPLPLPVPPVP